LSDRPPDSARIEGYVAKADESLAAAGELLKNGHPDFAASRAYYAVFYAASAALLQKGLTFRTHRGLIGAVHQHLVKTGQLPTKAGETINSLFEDRQLSDYEPLPSRMPQMEAEKALELAQHFVSEIKAMLQKEDER